MVFESHPMEAWVALHAQALQQTAAQQHLWERVLEGLRLEAHARSPPKPKAPGSQPGAAAQPPAPLPPPIRTADSLASVLPAEPTPGGLVGVLARCVLKPHSGPKLCASDLHTPAAVALASFSIL